MWDLSSLVNQCVNCGCKFTSPERPLKLLPCLHSMCLDCLYGRVPVKINTENKEDAASKLEVSSSKLPVAEEEAKTDEVDEETVLNETSDQQVEESTAEKPESTTEKPEENGKTEEDSTSGNQIDHDDTKEDVPEKSQEGLEDDACGDEAKTSIVTDKPEGEGETNSQSEDVDLPLSERSTNENLNNELENQTEAQDIKPKPVKECPICKDTIVQPPTSLMDNMFATLDMTPSDESSVNTSQVCTACEEGQEADSYCIQCEEWLCGSCVDAHKRVRVTKDHVISPKDQVSSATSKSPWEQQMTCKQHRQEQLKFFCEKCEAMTCRDCQLMDHKEHKYQFLDQAAEQYKARLKGSLALMGEKRSKLTTSRDEIEQKLMNCKEQKDTVQADILRQADILVKRIRQAVWGVLSNLASFTDAATKRLNKEIEDVSDLIGKFEHCIQFMEDILKNGTSMSLLYSKGSVEAKCRKVYHTQVDPQSLKGNLMIQYKHDVNWLLNSLNKIGAIFVNGVRYPPEKAGAQQHQRQHQPNNGSSSYPDPRGGMSATSPHLQHMANQAVPGQRGVGSGDEWTKFIQTVSKPVAINAMPSQSVGPPNMSLAAMGGSANSLPPQLTLPSRRASNSAVGGHTWTGMPGSSFSSHFSQSQQVMSQQQQQQQHGVPQSRPNFTPMRLHHRPAAHPPSFSSQNDRGSGSMRSPPTYRTGGEASGSSSNMSSRSAHGTPDPARPASAGMYDANTRPDSGGPAMVDIKKERRDQSPDCIITSTSLRSEKQSLFQTSPLSSRMSETVLEMQKNLDDVIRAVPMDLSDNLEQISGSRLLPEDTANSTNPKLMSPFPNLSQNQVSNPSTLDSGAKSPTDEELRENWQGGNSMPGFSIPSNLQTDPNDDYCACCHNGGDVLCCDKCPRVFHLQCHIPELPSVPSGSFVCTICEGDGQVEPEELNPLGKRKADMADHDVKVCERILLDLFCHPSSIPFHEPVNKEQVPNYYKIITQPRDFNLIRSKLRKQSSSHYQSIWSFLYDLRQVFINCAIYNKESSEVGKAGRMVRELFESLVGQLMPQYQEFVKENPSPCFSALQRQGEPDAMVVSGPAGDGTSQAATTAAKKTVVKSEENGCGPCSPKRMKLDVAGT